MEIAGVIDAAAEIGFVVGTAEAVVASGGKLEAGAVIAAEPSSGGITDSVDFGGKEIGAAVAADADIAVAEEGVDDAADAADAG